MVLLSLFTAMYETLIGVNTEVDDYSDGLFDSIGLISFVISLAFCMLFYLALGRWRNVWYTRVHWTLTVVLVACLGFGLAFLQSKSQLGVIDGYLIRFALFNSVYTAVIFILLSLIFKRFSIFSKRTPF